MTRITRIFTDNRLNDFRYRAIVSRGCVGLNNATRYNRTAAKEAEDSPYIRQAKAESLIINSVGHRPTNRNASSTLALKGRHRDFALSGLRLRGLHQNRALPYPNDNKAFSLSLTGIKWTAKVNNVVHKIRIFTDNRLNKNLITR